MNAENIQKLYTSPEVKVKEIKARKVICDSYKGNPTKMGWGEDNGNDWE